MEIDLGVLKLILKMCRVKRSAGVEKFKEESKVKVKVLFLVIFLKFNAP